MENWILPEGWKFARLTEQNVEMTSGFSCARKHATTDGLLHLRPFNIGNDGELDFSERIYIPENFVATPSDFYLESGDILFNNTNSVELVGKSGIARTNLVCAFSNHLTRIRVKDKNFFEPSWILIFLRYLWQTGYFAANCNRWIGQAGFAPTKLTELSIPRPPISEQRRIVARLEALLSEVRALRDLLQSMRRDWSALIESALAEVFPDVNNVAETRKQGWEIYTLEEISTPPQYGYTASSRQEPVGPKFLRITDIQDGSVDWERVPYCQIEERQVAKYELRNGDIVFARSGATTGKTYLIIDPPKAVFASYLIRIRIQEKSLPEFVYWFFQSPQYWKQLTLRGGAQPNMNAQLLRQVRIPLPYPDDPARSLAEQRRIVAYLEAVQEEVSAARRQVEEDERRVTQLEQSILAAAFRGEV